MTAAILAGALDNPEKYIRMIMEMPSKIQRRLRSNRIEQAANLFSNATEPKHYLAPCWVYAADPRDPDKLFYVTKVLSKGDDKTYDSPWECTQGTQRGDGIDRGIFQLPSQDVKFGGDEMPLMAAVCNNDTESARTLLGLAPRSSRRKLKKIAQLINGRDPHGRTALYWAARLGNDQICDMLLASGADVDATQDLKGTPLFIASQNGHYNVVQTLLAQGANFSISTIQGAKPLHVASQRGRNEICRALLKVGSSPNDNSHGKAVSPLLLASQNGHLEVVKLLLSQGADPNFQTEVNLGATALFSAVRNGHKLVAKELLGSGADPTLADFEYADTPLLTSLDLRDIEIVKLLVNHGADVNQPNKENLTPLIVAAAQNQTAIVEFLLQNLANPNAMSNRNDSALLWATYHKNYPLAISLIEKGANVNCKAESGVTPLLLAVGHQMKDLVSYLVDHGADVNECHPNGLTPLEIARQMSLNEIAHLLLLAGAEERANPAPNKEKVQAEPRVNPNPPLSNDHTIDEEEAQRAAQETARQVSKALAEKKNVEMFDGPQS